MTPATHASTGTLFDDRPAGRMVLDVVVAPLVLGAITVATLHVPVLYWILSVLAAAAVATGLEHRSWLSALRRGVIAGLTFGIGVVIIYFSIRGSVSVQVSPAPSIGTPIVTALAGGILTVAGLLVFGRRAAR